MSSTVWSVTGRGSYFAGAPDPKDLDLLVVADEPITRPDAIERLRPVLDPLPRHLPLDLHIVTPAALNTWERAVVIQGEHLDGVAVGPTLRPVTWPEWCWFMAWWARTAAVDDPPAAALAAVRALLAWSTGEIVAMSKYLVPPAAHACEERLGDIAAAAWAHRGPGGEFTHPDLAATIDAAQSTFAGTTTWSRQGRVVATLFAGVFDPVELASASADAEPPPSRIEDGGWTKKPCHARHLAETLWTLGLVANERWGRYRLTGYEQLEVHHYGHGTTFPVHVDRQDDLSPQVEAAVRARHPNANLDLLRSRAQNVVAMVHPAEVGGELLLWLHPDAPVRPNLDPGDVIVFDGAIPHEVTCVEQGHRVTLVTHTHD